MSQNSRTGTIASDKKPHALFRFKSDFTGQTADVGHGEYSHKFNRQDEPFVASDEEEARMMRGLGLFEEVMPETTLISEKTKDGPFTEESSDGASGDRS
jgi:hypothetical protein